MKNVDIFTDGGCNPNPGPGAWAAILRYAGVEREITGVERSTTNNRMEMMAAIMALEALKEPCRVRLHSDSMIVVNGASLASSIATRMKKARQGRLINADLWARIDHFCSVHDVTWVWVRGHNGHIENERCDHLVRIAMADAL